MKSLIKSTPMLKTYLGILLCSTLNSCGSNDSVVNPAAQNPKSENSHSIIAQNVSPEALAFNLKLFKAAQSDASNTKAAEASGTVAPSGTAATSCALVLDKVVEDIKSLYSEDSVQIDCTVIKTTGHSNYLKTNIEITDGTKTLKVALTAHYSTFSGDSSAFLCEHRDENQSGFSCSTPELTALGADFNPSLQKKLEATAKFFDVKPALHVAQGPYRAAMLSYASLNGLPTHDLAGGEDRVFLNVTDDVVQLVHSTRYPFINQHSDKELQSLKVSYGFNLYGELYVSVPGRGRSHLFEAPHPSLLGIEMN